jgi:hypothetical protein
MKLKRRLLTLFFTLLLISFAVSAPAAQTSAKASRSGGEGVSAKDLAKQAELDARAERWEDAAAKLKKAAELKPNDKKIAEALAQANTQVADRTANRAIDFCNHDLLDKCEQEAQRAATFSRTQRVKDVESQLATRKGQLQARYAKVDAMATAGQFAEAATELQSLTPFSYLFPDLATTKKRVHDQHVASLIATGNNLAKEQKWEEAMNSYTAALTMDPGNAQAKAALNSAGKEREAQDFFEQAQGAQKAKNYKLAYETNQKAQAIFPGRAPYEELNHAIAGEWTKLLMDDVHRLSANPDDTAANQQAYAALEMIRRLDPRFPNLADESLGVRTILLGNYLNKAREYLAIADNSRVGTAYLYFQNAQRVNPSPDFAFSARMRDAENLFKLKRSMQIVINVQNLLSSAPAFSSLLTTRIEAAIETMGVADLKIRTLDDYQKSPDEDPQFIENRPDHKSGTAQFIASIEAYDSETLGNDKPIEKPSKFVAGVESVDNPEYTKVEQQYRDVSQAIAKQKPKPGKTTKEGYSVADQTMLGEKLKATPQKISQEKIVDYTYQEYHLTSRAAIKIKLDLRDMIEKQLIASELVEAEQVDNQVEVANVRPTDSNNLINRTARLKKPEDMLRFVEREALQKLDEKAKKLSQLYLQRFYNEGERALKDGRKDDAVENFLSHWFAFRGQVDEKQAERIRGVVKEITGCELN